MDTQITFQTLQIGLSIFAMFRFFHSSLKPIKPNWLRIKKNNQNFGFYYFLPVIVPEFFYSLFVILGFSCATLFLVNALLPEFPGFLKDKNSIAYYSILAFLISSLVLTAFDSKTIFSTFFLWLTEIFNSRINQGWINAKWHLNDEPDYYIKINENRLKRISNDIINQIANLGVDVENQTQKPNVSDEELGNYLLIGNSIENLIHRDHPGNKKYLPNWWEFMKFCAESEQKPFLPQNLKNSVKEQKDFYNYLKVIAGDNVEIVAIQNLDINEVLRFNVKVLTKKFNGSTLKMAKGTFGNSSKRLFKNLKKFKSFSKTADRDETYKRLFFKQAAVRHSLWKKMKCKNFSFPHSTGISIFFLNTQILDVNPKKDMIKEELNFKNLVVECLTSLVKEIHRKITVNPDDRTTLDFIQAIGHDSELLKIADTIDYIIFNHSRKYCSDLLDNNGSGYNLGCRLGDNMQNQCNCDISTVRWVRGSTGHINKIR